MKNFTIETKYQGITNSQRFADNQYKTEHSEITGMQNVKLILEKTKLNESAAEDLSYVVSNCTEEKIQRWIEFRVQEIFTIASFLLEAKEDIVKNKQKDILEKQIEEYFQWDSIDTNPKFSFETEESLVDWDLPPIAVLKQLYPIKYYEYLDKINK